MTRKKQNVVSLLEESHGNIAERFDALDDKTGIIIFKTSREIGVYKVKANNSTFGSFLAVDGLRTRFSGDGAPQRIACMRKGQFYEYNMLAALCALKEDRPINYYGI